MNTSRTFMTKKDLDLQAKKEQLLKERIYYKVFEEVLMKIKYQNRMRKKDTIIVVPRNKIGLPSYNYEEVLVFIIKKLREQDFYVRLIPQDQLYVSWLTEDEILGKIESKKYLENEKN